jgi:exodeoxyribonuclease VII small subunit
VAKKRPADIDHPELTPPEAIGSMGSGRDDSHPPSRRPASRRFESAVDEIEQIVSRLESGELDLAESLQQYAKGIETLKECHELLADAERRVTMLSGFDADGNPITSPLDPTQSVGSLPEGATAKSAGGRRPSVRRSLFLENDDEITDQDVGG